MSFIQNFFPISHGIRALPYLGSVNQAQHRRFCWCSAFHTFNPIRKYLLLRRSTHPGVDPHGVVRSRQSPPCDITISDFDSPLTVRIPTSVSRRRSPPACINVAILLLPASIHIQLRCGLLRCQLLLLANIHSRFPSASSSSSIPSHPISAILLISISARTQPSHCSA